MGNSRWDHADDQPYFFLSYAHTPHAPRQDQGEQTDPDYWVGQLFHDLSRHMREMLHLPSGANSGFMDRELRLGNEWPAALGRALATCRVFVPLYSRRYFASVHCGKEWTAFTHRMARYQGRSEDRARFIVPALWVPVPVLPEVGPYKPATFGKAYADLGFYGIMKLTRYRDEYETAVRQLAEQIVAAGTQTHERALLPPGPVVRYARLENAFGAPSPTRDGERRVLVAVATPDASSPSPEGSAARYPKTARQWTPYPHESKRPLTEEAFDLASNLGYLPEVGGLTEHVRELVSHAPPTRAMVLIVDPRAATVPELRAILREIDRANKPWISVVVVWNPKDSTPSEEDELRKALEAALPHKLVAGRVTEALAIRGVPTLADFGTVVPAVLRAAERSFLRSASGAHDPAVK